jgi:hypothetical protein
MGKVGIVASVSLVVSLGAMGCSAPGDAGSTETQSAGDTSSSDLSSAKSKECTLDTFWMANGFITDFRDAIDPSNIHDYGSQYWPHIEIPGFFDAAVPPTDDDGEFFYTIVGFGFHKEELPTGSTAQPRLVASLEAHPAPASLPFAANQYDAAKAIFTAMTRATETTEHHVAPKNSYDQSWDKVTRTSAAGRTVCTSTVYPNTGETRPVYACTFYDIIQNGVQTFDPKDAGNKCIAKTM